MKRLATLATVLTLCAGSLIGCGSSGESDADKKLDTAAPTANVPAPAASTPHRRGSAPSMAAPGGPGK